MSAWPPRAAVFKALKPVVVGVAIDAPRSINSSQTSSRPFWHATRSGLLRRARGRRRRPAAAGAGAHWQWPPAHAHQSGAPRPPSSSTRLPSSSRRRTSFCAAAAGGGDQLHWCCGGVALVGQPQSAYLHLLAAIFPRESTEILGSRAG